MNKSDLKLIVIIIIFFLIFFLTFKQKNNNQKEAIVYYNGNEILKIDLTIKELQEYVINGYNGEVKVQTENGKIRVLEENSPYHLCSKQSWIKESYETIVCLPNKIVVKINNLDKIDAEV